MFEKLKRFFQGEPPPTASVIEHPELGTLSWSKDEEAWLSSAAHNGVGFVFQINGTPEPNQSLVGHAVDIARKKAEFNTCIQRFLQEEAASAPELRELKDEIAGLRIESVCLFWPDRPDDGMIFFAGGRDHRVWRCDYIGRVPKGLGFDS
jgi:hypothetical protein